MVSYIIFGSKFYTVYKLPYRVAGKFLGYFCPKSETPPISRRRQPGDAISGGVKHILKQIKADCKPRNANEVLNNHNLMDGYKDGLIVQFFAPLLFFIYEKLNGLLILRSENSKNTVLVLGNFPGLG